MVGRVPAAVATLSISEVDHGASKVLMPKCLPFGSRKSARFGIGLPVAPGLSRSVMPGLFSCCPKPAKAGVALDCTSR